MPRRLTSRRTRAVVAGALALPLLAVPTVASAAALAPVAYRTDLGNSPFGDSGSYGGYSSGITDPYGAYGSYGSSGGYGSYGSYGSSGGYGSYGTTQTTTQDATAATSEESTGVVLIDTTIDYDEGEAAGTGLVIGSDGTVVTNHHVVEGATSISVTDPSSGSTYSATVVGYDSTHDVAVLQLSDASGLATVATDTTTSVGEAVTAVGNAEGGGTLTAASGAITVNRTAIDVTEDDGSTAHLARLIEDDADVVSGDSGGALLDSDEEVVGMNVAATSGTTEVRGYAIPIARVLRIARRIEAGEASATITIGSSAALGIQLGSTSSLLVGGVVSDGAAEAAGVVAGDTITALDGTSVSTYDELTAVLGDLSAGDQVTLAWTDSSGAARSATVTLGAGPVG